MNEKLIVIFSCRFSKIDGFQITTEHGYIPIPRVGDRVVFPDQKNNSAEVTSVIWDYSTKYNGTTIVNVCCH